MDNNLKEIALITTVSNLLLYKKSVNTFPENIDLIAIDGTKGLFGILSIKFMFSKISSKKYKWIIMADEDVLFVNPNGVFEIIEKMKNSDIDVCGIRDGGVLSWRNKNPYIINPFFCILNFEKIKSIYSEKEIDKHQYIIENEFNDDLSVLPFPCDINSMYEEYYCFFLWLRRKDMVFHFLDAISDTFENDPETTTVFDLNNKVMLYHTWYARTYGVNEFHTKRINNVLNSFSSVEKLKPIKIIWLKNYFFNYKKNVFKFKHKIKKILK